MKPTLGRIVHYTSLGDRDGRYPAEQQAAVITKVVAPEPLSHGLDSLPEESRYEVGLHVFYATGDFYMQAVPYSESYQRGHWTWPPREA